MERNFSLFVIFFLLAVSASATEKRYLVLGADPQAENRQPTANEEVVIANVEVCDSGWGTGSGKKVSGCYPPHTAYIRDKVTKLVVAVFVCGNKPSDQHRVAGKVIPPEIAIKEIPVYIIPDDVATKTDLAQAVADIQASVQTGDGCVVCPTSEDDQQPKKFWTTGRIFFLILLILGGILLLSPGGSGGNGPGAETGPAFKMGLPTSNGLTIRW